MPAQIQHTQNTFFHDPLVHLGNAEFPVLKNDGDLFDLEAQLPGGELHLDLEGIADKFDLVQIDRLQYLLPIAYKSCRRVLYRHPGDQPRIVRSSTGKQDPVARPVDITAALDIPGTDGNITALAFAGLIKTVQVLRVMREIGVHLEDELVVVPHRLFKTMDIGRS